MDPFSIAGIIAGGVDAVTNMFDTFSGTSSSRQYKYQRRLQQHDQEFQKMMSDTAVQRRVADLEKAGINPILASGGGAEGSGASTGTIAQQAGQTSLLDKVITAKNLTKMNEEIKNIQQNTKTAEALEENYRADAQNKNANTALTNTENQIKNTKTTAAINAEKLANTKWGKYISPILADIGQIFGGAGSAAIAGAQISQARTAREKIKEPKRNKIGFK